MLLEVGIQEGPHSTKSANLYSTFLKLLRNSAICTPGVSIINKDKTYET